MSLTTSRGTATVGQLCEAFGISRQAYYAARKEPRREEKERGEPRRAGRRGDALGDRVAARHHEVVALARKVRGEVADRPGKERKQLAVVAPHSGQTRERARVDAQALDAIGGRPRNVEQRVEVRIGKECGVLVENPFPAPETREPIVDQSHPHQRGG